ncbi:MAG: prolipoprotein diacylglyceryl transferase [Ruminococcaceae bacterium]|nr:prolipoprotein diacylglyceryl transferase [Oscillospiraceae bacterium]
MVNVISFPGFGIHLTVNRVAFEVFGKEIFWYALIIMSGFLLGVAFVYHTCSKRGVSKDAVWDVAFYGLIFGLIGARIYYVIFDWESMDGNFWNVFKVWEGGLAIYGGLIGAVLTAYVYCKRKKIAVWKVFDVCAPGLLIGQSIGRWGNFVNAEVYGKATDLPWGMSINGGACVHPLFLYESLWNLLGLVLVILFRDKKKADGQVFLFYLLWYGIGRLFLEGMRESQYILYVIPNILGISQVVAFLAIIFSGIFLFRLSTSTKKQTLPENVEKND